MVGKQIPAGGGITAISSCGRRSFMAQMACLIACLVFRPSERVPGPEPPREPRPATKPRAACARAYAAKTPKRAQSQSCAQQPARWYAKRRRRRTVAAAWSSYGRRGHGRPLAKRERAWRLACHAHKLENWRKWLREGRRHRHWSFRTRKRVLGVDIDDRLPLVRAHQREDFCLNGWGGWWALQFTHMLLLGRRRPNHACRQTTLETEDETQNLVS